MTGASEREREVIPSAFSRWSTSFAGLTRIVPYFGPTDEFSPAHDRDQLERLNFPEDENFNVPDIWIVETYPPSFHADLQHRIRAMAKRGIRAGEVKKISDYLIMSRTTNVEYSWTSFPGFRHEEIPGLGNIYSHTLPSEFSQVDIMLVCAFGTVYFLVFHFRVERVLSLKLQEQFLSRFTTERRQFNSGYYFIKAEEKRKAAIDNLLDSYVRLGVRWIGSELPGLFHSRGSSSLPPHAMLILLGAGT